MSDENDTQIQPHQFPFEVPTSFAAHSDDELQALAQETLSHSRQFQIDVPTDESVGGLEACAELATRLNQELQGRAVRVSKAASASGPLDQLATFGTTASTDGEDGDDSEDGDEDEGGGEAAPAVTAAAGSRPRPRTRDIARNSGTPQVTAVQETPRHAVMKASSDVPHFSSGQQLDTFAQAALALSNRLEQYPAMTAQRARGERGKRAVTAYDPQGRKLTMTHFARHGGVQFVRQFPDQLRVNDSGGNGYAVAEFAASERRLDGGNLLKSAAARVKAGRAITAAAAWCAPSDVIYELCELESMDGLLSAPELQTARGGWQIPIDGGPNFASIWNGIGNAGDTHLSEQDVIDDVAKVCNEIPCPDFEDVRLGVDYVCLTGGLLQRRGYPEIVARFSRGAMIALAHKMNMGFIAAIVAASGPATVIPQVDNGDDAASALLSAVELAVVDTKYANRMSFTTTLEVVMPMWFLAPIRAAIARRTGVAMLAVTDAEIMDWFAIRRAVPQFVYDWQDAYTGLAGGPGGVTPLEAFPEFGQFLVYPAGTWVKAVQDVVSLDTIYDSTNLQTNQYTAIFAEDGWAALQMCPDSRLYEVALNPDGVVGCCPPTFTSL